jgi:hypothetical protein
VEIISDNKIVNTAQGSFILPKYFVMNANAYYDTKKFRIGVKVDNFTNEHYWIGYTTANPRSWQMYWEVLLINSKNNHPVRKNNNYNRKPAALSSRIFYL